MLGLSSFWNKENKRFHAFVGTMYAETMRAAMCKMCGVASFSEIGVGDLMGMNEKLVNVDEKSREIGIMKFINMQVPELVVEEAATAKDEEE